MNKAFAFAVAVAAISLSPATASAKPAAHTATIVVDKLAFGAVPSNLRVGDTIVWANHDLFRHSATAIGHFDVDLPPGSKRSMVLRRAGVFPFTCKFHPGMKGVLKVGR